MNILIDGTSIRSNPSGIGIYGTNFIDHLIDLALTQDNQGNKVNVLYKNRDFAQKIQQKYDRFRQEKLLRLIPYNLPSQLSLMLLKPVLKSCFKNVNIHHGLDHLVYDIGKSNVMTIHDLSFIKYPQYAPDRVLKTYYKRIKTCLAWTQLILTVSENSKQDIIQFFDIHPDKIFVTPLGCRYYPNNQIFRNSKDPCRKTIPYPQHQIHSQPYLLFVGTLEPRKNIESIIQAFSYLKRHHNITHSLVLIGQNGWKYDSILRAIDACPWKENIYHFSYVDDVALAHYYQGASVFIYPSHYEGFGLPVLEALTLGIPVVTSNVSSLPEVVGDAALLVNPNDFIDLADAILSVIQNPELQWDLIQKGYDRSHQFSWKNTAKLTWMAYQKLSKS